MIIPVIVVSSVVSVCVTTSTVGVSFVPVTVIIKSLLSLTAPFSSVATTGIVKVSVSVSFRTW